MKNEYEILSCDVAATRVCSRLDSRLWLSVPWHEDEQKKPDAKYMYTYNLLSQTVCVARRLYFQLEYLKDGTSAQH